MLPRQVPALAELQAGKPGSCAKPDCECLEFTPVTTPVKVPFVKQLNLDQMEVVPVLNKTVNWEVGDVRVMTFFGPEGQTCLSLSQPMPNVIIRCEVNDLGLPVFTFRPDR